MKRIGYFNSIISDGGKPILATVTVYLQGTSTKATIYSDPAGTAQKDNPFQTDSYGRFQFFAEAGQYDLEISGTGITAYKIENVFLDSPYSWLDLIYDDEDIIKDGNDIIFDSDT